MLRAGTTCLSVYASALHFSQDGPWPRVVWQVQRRGLRVRGGLGTGPPLSKAFSAQDHPASPELCWSQEKGWGHLESSCGGH